MITITRVRNAFKDTDTPTLIKQQNIEPANEGVNPYEINKHIKGFSMEKPLYIMKDVSKHHKLSVDEIEKLINKPKVDESFYDGQIQLDFSQMAKTVGQFPGEAVLNEFIKKQNIDIYKQVLDNFKTDEIEDTKQMVINEMKQFNEKLQLLPFDEKHKDKLIENFIIKLFDKLGDQQIQFKDIDGHLLPEFQNEIMNLMMNAQASVDADSFDADSSVQTMLAGDASATAEPWWKQRGLPPYKDIKKMKLDDIKQLVKTYHLQVETGVNPMTEKPYTKQDILQEIYEFYYE